MLSKRLTLGANFGTIVSLPVSGWLCSLDFDGGWPLCFYLFGFTGIIWFAFWCFLVYNTPSSHPRINPQEKAFILASIAPQVSRSSHRNLTFHFRPPFFRRTKKTTSPFRGSRYSPASPCGPS
jgi:hypothetical protein